MLKIAEWTNSTYMKKLPKPLLMIRIFFARFISQNLIAVDTMKSTRRIGALITIGSVGSMTRGMGGLLMVLCSSFLLDCNETFKQLFSHGWSRRFVGMGVL